jgi:hypothetical protein
VAQKKLGGKKRGAAKPKRSLKRRRFGEEGGGGGAEAAARAPRATGGGSSDEYDSGAEAKVGSDDERFIDREGDDKGLLREYERERQVFDDEAPRRGKKKKRGAVDRGEDLTGSKPGRKGKSAAEAAAEDEARRQAVRRLLAQMLAAAKADYLARKAGQPAVAKIRLLDDVRTAVDDMRLHEALLEGPGRGMERDPEGTLLGVFREWLRPLPGTVLPSLQVREAVYGFLSRLPLTLDHLRDSGIAPLLRALSSHDGETPGNRATLTNLCQTFTRQIFHKSTSYRNHVPEMLAQQARRGMVSAPSAGSGGGGGGGSPTAAAAGAAPVADLVNVLLGGGGGGGGAAADAAAAAAAGGEGEEGAPAAAPREMRESLHARIPAPLVFDYVQRPDVAAPAPVQRPPPSSGTLAVAKMLRAGKKKT